MLGFSFVDNTNFITWEDFVAENCRRLEAAHNCCVAWANRHDVAFALEKYQLMHFIRRRRYAIADLASTVRITS